MTKVVTELVVVGNGELALKGFERGMEAAGTATDRTTGAVAGYEARLEKARVAMERQQAVSMATVAAKNREQAAFERFSAMNDRQYGLRLKLEREAERASVAATNAVLRGYASQDQALQMLIATEARHAAQLRAVESAADGAAIASARIAANDNGYYQRRNLQFQMMDVGQSIAGGMPLHMVLMQQGPQIAQIYGSEEGGVGRALKEAGSMAMGLATKLAPIAGIAALTAGAFAGLTHEINQTSGVAVSMGDVFTATWQVIGGGLYNLVRPAVEMMGNWFGEAWDWVVQATKDAGNWMVRSIVGSIEYIKTSIWSLPDAFLVAGEAAAQALVDTITMGVNNVTGNIDSLIRGVNSMAGRDIFSPIGQMTPAQIDLGGANAQKRYDDAWSGYRSKIGALSERDIMGELFGNISSRAQELALARQEIDAVAASTQKVAAAHDQLSEAAKAAKEQMMEVYNFGRSTFSSIFTDIGQSIRDGSDMWMAFGAAGLNALNKIADRALSMAGEGIFDMLFGGFFGGMAAPGGAIWGVSTQLEIGEAA